MFWRIALDDIFARMPHSAGNEQAGAGIVCVYYMSAIVYNVVNYAEHPLTVGTACG